MMGRIVGVVTALFIAAAFTFSTPATAEAQASFGPQLSYGSEIEALGIGARADLSLGNSGFGAIGSFDYFFPDVGDWYEFNANARYAFSGGGSAAPYVGAGLNYVSQEAGGFSTTNTGINFLGGAKFGAGGLSPFLEGRYSTVGTGQIVITGGLLF